MAIPFNFPSDQETEDSYRRLDQLLLNLYEILRLILIRSRRDRDNTGRVENDEPGGSGNGRGAGVQRQEVERRPPLLPPRRRRRHNTLPQSHKNLAPPSVWFNLGVEVKLIQEEFRTRQSLENGVEKIREKKSLELKASSLISLFVPAPLCGPIWTTVILVVGWKLINSHR